MVHPSAPAISKIIVMLGIFSALSIQPIEFLALDTLKASSSWEIFIFCRLALIFSPKSLYVSKCLVLSLSIPAIWVMFI